MKICLKYLLIIQILLLSCNKKNILINPKENNIKQLVEFLSVKQNKNLLVKTVDWKNLSGTTTINLGYGNITSYQYDSKGNLSNFISKSFYNDEVETIFEHQNKTYPTKVYDKEGRLEKEFEYDSNKNVIKIKRYSWPNPKFLEETNYEYKGNTIVKIEQFVTLDGINYINEYSSYLEDDRIISNRNGQETIIYLSQDEYQLPIQINDLKVEYSLSNDIVYIKKKNPDGSVSVEEIVFDEKVKPNIPKIQGENKLVPKTIYDISQKNPLKITKWIEKDELDTGKLTKIISSEESFDYEYNSFNLPIKILHKRKEMYNDLNKRTIISYY